MQKTKIWLKVSYVEIEYISQNKYYSELGDRFPWIVPYFPSTPFDANAAVLILSDLEEFRWKLADIHVLLCWISRKKLLFQSFW